MAELSDLLASGNFDGVLVIDVVKKILEPFNYVIVFEGDGSIKRLQIVSSRVRPAVGTAAAAGPASRTSGVDPDIGQERERPTDLVERIEERSLFESVDVEPPPELLWAFEPWTEPGSGDAGPGVDPDMVVEDLPEFTPYTILSESEAISPADDYRELPVFEPVVSETGPVPETPVN